MGNCHLCRDVFNLVRIHHIRFYGRSSAKDTRVLRAYRYDDSCRTLSAFQLMEGHRSLLSFMGGNYCDFGCYFRGSSHWVGIYANASVLVGYALVFVVPLFTYERVAIVPDET